jgi:hypothetical protein
VCRHGGDGLPKTAAASCWPDEGCDSRDDGADAEAAEQPGGGTDEVTDWDLLRSEQARDWCAIGRTLHSHGRLALGADLLVRASCLDVGSKAMREAAAMAQFAAGQYLGSWVTFSAMGAVDPGDEFARYGAGLCRARMGYFAAALVDLTEAARRRPDGEKYAHALAVVREVLDELEGDPVVMPSYRVPPVPIPATVLALVPGPRPSHGR